MKERDIQKLIMDWLNTLPNTRAWRRNVAGARKFVNESGAEYYVPLGKRGQADIWGVCAGKHFEIETKRPGKQPTEEQRQWLEELARVGAVCFVADSLDALQEIWPWN